MATTHRGNLDDRKAAVLRAIVSHYVTSGEPAGSKLIAERFNLGVSPATVRNDMGALEESGFIYQPHTSAGRIPTDLGYRYYVDAWTREARLPAGESRRVRQFFLEPRYELEEALRQTARFLSTLTDHAAIVFAPALGPSHVRHVELVELSSGRAMLVIVTDTGRVENYVISLPDGVDEIQLERAADMLNRLVEGVPLLSAGTVIETALERFPLELRETIGNVVSTIKEEIDAREAERLYLEGTANIVDEHKFADLETVRQVISALEHRRLLLEVVADALSEQIVSVRIGSENTVEGMQLCSIVTAPYMTEGGVAGSLGVVGPTRMDYRRTIAAVHEVAASLGRMLSEL